MGEGPTKQPHRPWISHDFIQVFASCFGIFLHPASFRIFVCFAPIRVQNYSALRTWDWHTLLRREWKYLFPNPIIVFWCIQPSPTFRKTVCGKALLKYHSTVFDGRLLVRIGCWCFFLQFRWAPGKHISAVQVVMFFWQNLIVVCPFVASSSALRAYIVAKFISSLTWIVCANGTPLRSWTQEIAFRWTCQMHNYRSKRLKFSIEWRAPGGCRSMVREYNPPVPNGNKTNITFQSWSKQLCETISLTSLP